MSVGGFEVPDMSDLLDEDVSLLLDEELDSEEPDIGLLEKSTRKQRELSQSEKDVLIGKIFTKIIEDGNEEMTLEEALAKAKALIEGSWKKSDDVLVSDVRAKLAAKEEGFEEGVDSMTQFMSMLKAMDDKEHWGWGLAQARGGRLGPKPRSIKT